jgi:hypothetical protein
MKESSPVKELYLLDLLAPLKYYTDAAPKRSKNKQFIFQQRSIHVIYHYPGAVNFLDYKIYEIGTRTSGIERHSWSQLFRWHSMLDVSLTPNLLRETVWLTCDICDNIQHLSEPFFPSFSILLRCSSRIVYIFIPNCIQQDNLLF